MDVMGYRKSLKSGRSGQDCDSAHCQALENGQDVPIVVRHQAWLRPYWRCVLSGLTPLPVASS
eukprot:scaffold212406_cov33-Prasinocladus_malaysianus.AAC.1